MSDVTLNDIDVISGDLILPRIGNWSAHLWIDTEIPPGGKVTLTWLGTTFEGFVLRAGEEQGQVRVLVGGGAGGLSKIVPAKMYDFSHSLELPLNEIISKVGEFLSPNCSRSVLAHPMTNWVRLEGEASVLLSQLVDQMGAIWRVMPDGSIWVGMDDYPNTEEFEYDLLESDPTGAVDYLSAEEVRVFPGQTFLQKLVGCVVYEISPDRSLMKVFYQDSKNNRSDPFKAGIEALVSDALRGIDYFLTYSGEVVAQRPDGTLDIRIDSSTKLPPLTSVPYQSPVPGASLKVNPKERVQVIFEGGNPARHKATWYDPGIGGKAVARKGDKVNIGELVITAVGMGVLAGTYKSPYDAVPQPITLGKPISLLGEIIDGYEGFKLPNK